MKRSVKIYIKSWVLSITFLLVIYMPFIDQVFNISTPNLVAENRLLAEKPKADITRLDYFPNAYDAYFNDHFHFRNDLILLNSAYKFIVFDILPFDKVAKGKKGWLFNANEYLEDYRSKELFSEEDLKKMATALEYRQNWFNERGIKFYMAVAPNKPSIYEEYIPGFIYRVHGTSKYEQLKNYLIKNSTFQLIDVKDKLYENKEENLLFYKTDPHWNKLGGLLAYEKIIKNIKVDFPNIQPLGLNDFEIKYDTIEGKVLAEMLNMKSEYPDLEARLIPKFHTQSKYGIKKNYPIPEGFYYEAGYELVKYIPESDQPKALIIRDSFTNALKPFFDETFGYTVLIWDYWRYQMNIPIVENENPDIFLIVCVEKNLPRFLDNIEDFELEGFHE